jgi:O-acetyl-ADP-ribose deacetylase (regulator of RNase III)
MVEFITEGKFFEMSATFRVNTVNCNGVMGKGIALAFKKRYPKMYQDYKEKCLNRFFRPGDVDWYRLNKQEFVLNFATKGNWWEPSEYDWIGKGLSEMIYFLETFNDARPDLPNSVVMPAVGCSNGGLEWSKVKAMIQEAFADVQNDIKVFEPGKGI